MAIAPTRDDGTSVTPGRAQLGLDGVGGRLGGAVGHRPAGQRLAQAGGEPSRSNSWREPSRLMTTSRAASTRS